jgi:hypothetical protein
MYFILTDKDDVHHHHLIHLSEFDSSAKHICNTGVNIINKEIYWKIYTIIATSGENRQHRFKFKYGYANESTYVRMAIIANNMSSVILSDRYYILDPKIITKFNIKVDSMIIVWACKNGAIKFLDWWKNSGLPLEYDESALDFASKYGQVEVLEWWLKSGLELKYDEYALYLASEYSHINVLEWWKNSGLKLKDYDYDYILVKLSMLGNVNVLECWKNLGLPLKYYKTALELAFKNGHIDVIRWFIDNNFEVSLWYRIHVYYDTLKTNIKNFIGLQ